MKVIKKLVSVLMAGVLTLSVMACSGTDKNKTARELDIETPVTVNVWYDNKDYDSYLENVAKEFKEANNLVTVNPVYVESSDFVDTIYNETVRNDNVPDVYLMSSENCNKAYLLGLMLENDSYKDVYNDKVYGQAALIASSYNEKLYGYPVTFNMPVMVYNKSVQRIFNFDASSMFLNYTFTGRYVNIGGNNAEDSGAFAIDEVHFKKALTEYVKLKDTYAIDRYNSSLQSCVSQFAEGKLIYTIVDADSLSTIDASGVEYGIIPVPKLADDLESKAMSVTTMAIVNPYTSNIAVSKAVARAISYDYAEDLESLSGHMSARADISYKSKTQQSNYNTLHTIYANSIVKAKYVGVGNIYTKYEIMLHQLWDGVDFNSAYNEFYKEISNYMTLSRLNN